MEIIELFPLSQGELLGIQENSIELLFSEQPLRLTQAITISKRDFFELILKGGFPSVQESDNEARAAWFNSYISTILYRDVQDLAHISGLTELPNLLTLLATRAGNLLNVSELSRTSGIPHTTLNRYLTLLEILYIVHFQQAWSGHLGRRLTRAPKIFLVDSGLLSFSIDATIQKMITTPSFVGGIVENFVAEELAKQATWSSIRVKLFHYRTNTGIEVDLVIEHADGYLVGVEVKASETVTGHDFKGLRELQANSGAHFMKGIVVYTGTELIPFGKNLFAVPMSWLWQHH